MGSQSESKKLGWRGHVVSRPDPSAFRIDPRLMVVDPCPDCHGDRIVPAPGGQLGVKPCETCDMEGTVPRPLPARLIVVSPDAAVGRRWLHGRDRSPQAGDVIVSGLGDRDRVRGLLADDPALLGLVLLDTPYVAWPAWRHIAWTLIGMHLLEPPPRCPNDTDGDGDCPACAFDPYVHAPGWL